MTISPCKGPRAPPSPGAAEGGARGGRLPEQCQCVTRRTAGPGGPARALGPAAAGGTAGPLTLLLLVLLAAAAPAPACGITAFGRDCADYFVEKARPWALDEPGEPPARKPCLGYLIGIGVQKGGTTALWDYLKCGVHPRIWPRSRFKEMMWFDWIHTEGATLREYHQQLGKAFSPAADLDTLCPESSGSTVYRVAAAEGRRRCSVGDVRRCRRRGQQLPGRPAGAADRDGGGSLMPYSNVSSLRPAPFYLTDISPSYMMHPDTPINVRSTLPEARIVVMLREPAARAASAFNMVWKEKRKPEDRDSEEAFQRAFTEEMAEEMQLLASCYSKAQAKGGGADSALALQGPDVRRCLGIGPSTLWLDMDRFNKRFQKDYDTFFMPHRHVQHGVYADILSVWFNLFPQEQILIWASEGFKADPMGHINELVSWLGLDANLTAMAKRESSHEGQYRHAVPRGMMDALRAFYRPHNQRLFDLLRAKGFGAAAARLERLWN